MPLTDKAIRNAKPQSDKHICLYDTGGLYLEIAPAGGRWWRLKYRFAGKERRMSLGVYPEISLKDVRIRRDEARKLVANGIDPIQRRQAEKVALADRTANTFEALGREWHRKQSETWVPEHAARVFSRLERDLFPFIGSRPIADLEAPDLLTALQRIEGRGVRETVRRARQDCEQIFAFAIAAGKCKRNPAADLSKALAPKKKTVHFAAVTTPREFGDLLRTIDEYNGTFTVRCALRLAPLFAVRPGELRKAKWSDFDLDNAEWRFVASKHGPSHIVPLSRQALAILLDLHKLTGNGEYVFPGARSPKRPMSDAAVNAAMRRLEIPADVASGHGFRSSFRTLASEVLHLKPELLEMQLAHKVKNPLGRAYDRAEFLRERRKLMQRWSDYCDNLKETGGIQNLIAFKTATA